MRHSSSSVIAVALLAAVLLLALVAAGAEARPHGTKPLNAMRERAQTRRDEAPALEQAPIPPSASSSPPSPPSSALGLDPMCLAICAATNGVCQTACIGNKDFWGCFGNCEANAAKCAANCVLSAQEPALVQGEKQELAASAAAVDVVPAGASTAPSSTNSAPTVPSSSPSSPSSLSLDPMCIAICAATNGVCQTACIGNKNFWGCFGNCEANAAKCAAKCVLSEPTPAPATAVAAVEAPEPSSAPAPLAPAPRAPPAIARRFARSAVATNAKRSD